MGSKHPLAPHLAESNSGVPGAKGLRSFRLSDYTQCLMLPLWKQPESWAPPKTQPKHFRFEKGFTNKWSIPNVDVSVIHVNRDTIRRVKYMLIFADFIDRKLI